MFFLLMTIFQVSTFAADSSEKIIGRLGAVVGEVFVDGVQVKSGAKIRETSVIETKDGRATLLIGEGSVFHLAPESKMKVNQFAKDSAGTESADLEMKFGRTRGLVLDRPGAAKKDVKLRARSATMGIRGTEFFVDVPKDPGAAPQFITIEGKTSVQTGGSAPDIQMEAGEGVTAGGSGGSSGDQGGSGGEKTQVDQNQVENRVKDSGTQAPPPPMTSSEFKDLANGGFAPQAGLGNAPGIGDLPFKKPEIPIDPLADGLRQITISPRLIDAVTGNPN